jgi:protocatechuate 3,4-dioxygenase beta subunit
MNISPTLAVLDNGVVVCQYGRPGFHVVFSTDHGHTWRDRISFSHLPEPIITGQFDIVKNGPNRLAAIGSDAEGTKVWPITVERATVSKTRVALIGRVLDGQGNPIVGATVQRSPNRYAANDWTAVPTANGRKPRFAEPFFDPPRVCSTPVLAYRSIDEAGRYPTVRTDRQGRFQFDGVGLGETILTVETPGYSPRHRHVIVKSHPDTQEFTLKPGRRVRGRVTDQAGLPVAGACVVLDAWHTHTDDDGFFHWSVGEPLPQQVTVKAYKRYSGKYKTFKGTIKFSQLERQPITLQTQ